MSNPLPASAEDATPSRIWYTHCPVPTTSGIAQHQGWLQAAFAEQGIALESIRASGDRAVRESHFRHNLPGSFREGGNVPPIWARAQGQDTVVVGITWVDEQQLVLVRDDSTIRQAADLRGHRLGLVRQAASELVDVGRAEALRGLLTTLHLGGVSRDQVEFVDLTAPEWELKEHSERSGDYLDIPIAALLAGQVDAIFIKGAAAARAQSLGLRPIINLNDQQDPLLRLSAGSPRPITFDRQTLERAPQIVSHYLAVLLRTAEWAANHPRQVVTSIAAQTSADQASVRWAFGERLHLAFEPSLTPVYVEGLRRQKDFLLAGGFLQQDFDLDTWIDPRPLQHAHTLKQSIHLPE